MSEATCSAAGIAGLVSYLFTKLLVFAFLLERGESTSSLLYISVCLPLCRLQSTWSGTSVSFLGASQPPTASPRCPSWVSALSLDMSSPHDITSSDPTPAPALARAFPATSAWTAPLALPFSSPLPAPSQPFSLSSSSFHFSRLNSTVQGRSPAKAASPAPPRCAPRRLYSVCCCGMMDGSVHLSGLGLAELMVSLTWSWRILREKEPRNSIAEVAKNVVLTPLSDL